MGLFMKKVIPLILLFFVFETLSAQNNSVTGVVVDSLSRTPLYGASVTLYTTNNVVLGGVATDSKGKFTLDQLRTGTIT